MNYLPIYDKLQYILFLGPTIHVVLSEDLAIICTIQGQNTASIDTVSGK